MCVGTHAGVKDTGTGDKDKRGMREPSPHSPAANCTHTLLGPTKWLLPDTAPPTHEASREVAARPFWDVLGLGLQCSEGKQHPFQVSQGRGEQPRGSSRVAPACAHTDAHTSPSSQWLGSFPPLGPNSDKSHVWWTKTHKAPATRKHTHGFTHSYSLSLTDTRIHMVQADQSS